jgi:hypothetical protein
MLNPQVFYIVEIKDVDVSHAFSQASPDLHMVSPLPAVQKHGNHDGIVTAIAAQNPPAGERLGVDAFGSRSLCFGLDPTVQLSRRLRH